MNASIQQDFDNFVDKTILEIHKGVQDVCEQSLLIKTIDGWNNDNQAVVHLKLGVFSEEVPPIVGDADVIVIEDERHQVVILPTAFSNPAYMISRNSLLFGEGNQADTQA